jgi:hypothetical protein
MVCPKCGFDNPQSFAFCGRCGISTTLTIPVREAKDGQLARAERRQLSVMFCDLVGSTTLSGQLDPEELSDITRDYRFSLRRSHRAVTSRTLRLASRSLTSRCLAQVSALAFDQTDNQLRGPLRSGRASIESGKHPVCQRTNAGDILWQSKILNVRGDQRCRTKQA